MQDYHEFLDEILIPPDQLQQRIAELGNEISQDYQGKDIHLICILRGGVLFLADLMRQ
ncbi:MAG: phosphoribosyltransferase family protein, partial [Anaerolineales bacterium]